MKIMILVQKGNHPPRIRRNSKRKKKRKKKKRKEGKSL